MAKYIISQTLNTKEIPENIEKKIFAEIFCEKKNFREKKFDKKNCHQKNLQKKVFTKKKFVEKSFSKKNFSKKILKIILAVFVHLKKIRLKFG